MQYVEDRGRFVSVVSEFVNMRAYYIPRISVVVAREIAHVFKKEIIRLVMLYNLADIEEQIASVIIKTSLETRLRKRLSRCP